MKVSTTESQPGAPARPEIANVLVPRFHPTPMDMCTQCTIAAKGTSPHFQQYTESTAR